MSTLLDVKAVSGRLGISERKLWELTNRGEVACVRIGRRVLYDPVDVEAFVQKQKGKRRGSHGRK